MTLTAEDWAEVCGVCFDLVSVDPSLGKAAAAVALCEAHRHTRDVVTDVLLDQEGFRC